MLTAKQQGENGLQPCKFPTILILSSPCPSHNSKSDLYRFDKPKSSRCLQYVIAATFTLRDEALRAPRYHDLSCNRLTEKYHVQSEHLVPQSDVSKHGTLVSEGQQNSCLQGSVNSAHGPERCQGLYKFRLQNAHGDAGSSKPCGKEGRTQARGPGQGTAAMAVNLTAAVDTQPNDRQPPGAPPMRPIPLPKKQERDEYVLYGRGLDPGSWMTGNVQVDNVPKALSHLDMALPVPFA